MYTKVHKRNIKLVCSDAILKLVSSLS